MADLEAKIEELAQKPKEVEVDGQRVQEYDITQVIEADKYIKQSEAADTKTGGLRFVKLGQPGAI